MDFESLGPLGVFITAIGTIIGGAVAWTTNTVTRSHKEKREELLNAAIEKIETRDEKIADLEGEIKDLEGKIEHLKGELRRANSERTAWYWQLKDNGITPDPRWREAEYV